MAAGVTAAVPLPAGRVLTAVWDEARTECTLQLLSFRRDLTAFREGPLRGRNEARESLPRDLRARDRDLLVSFPLADASLRAALAEERVSAVKSAADLARLRREALMAYPGDRQELRAILEAVHKKYSDVDTPDAQDWFRMAYDVFIAPPPSAEASPDDGPMPSESAERDPLLAATIVRQLLTLPTLRLWRRTERPNSELSAWIGHHLRHPSAVVRLETLRALAEALRDLLSSSTLIPDVFPGTPAVRSVRWLLDGLAQFLFAHPTRLYGSESDASTWAAVSVLIGLMRLLPDSALVMLDHLSVNRVGGHVFGVIRLRLTSDEDREVGLQDKVACFSPWGDRDPSLAEIRDHCAAIRGDIPAEAREQGAIPLKKRCVIDDDSPDGEYWNAYVKCYEKLDAMTTPGWGEDLAQVAAKLDEPLPPLRHPRAPMGGEAPSAPPAAGWAQDLWDDRKVFFQLTDAWIQSFARPILSELALDRGEATQGILERIERERSRLSRTDVLPARAEFSVDRERPRSGGRDGRPVQAETGTFLADPERSIARTILLHWHDVIVAPQPRKGDFVGSYELGEPYQDHQYLFRVRDAEDRLVRIADARSREESRAITATWRRVQELSHAPYSHMARILSVIEGRRPALVMAMTAGVPVSSLAPAWGSHQRWELAFRCLVEIGSDLRAMHKKGLFHGDVTARNVLYGNDGSFHLIDFDKAGDRERLQLLLAPRGRSNDHMSYHYPSTDRPLDEIFETSAHPRADTVAGVQAWEAFSLYKLLVSIAYGGAAELERMSVGNAFLPEDEVSPYFKYWHRRLNERWEDLPSARTGHWSVDSLHDEAIGSAHNPYVFVSAPSDGEAGTLRRHLQTFESVGRLVVQGSFGVERGVSVLPQLTDQIRRCGVVAIVIDGTGGNRITEALPDFLRREREECLKVARGSVGDTHDDDGSTTFSQCEYLIARFLRKRIFAFKVEEPSNLLQKAIHHEFAQHGEVPRMTHQNASTLLGEMYRPR